MLTALRKTNAIGLIDANFTCLLLCYKRFARRSPDRLTKFVQIHKYFALEYKIGNAAVERNRLILAKIETRRAALSLSKELMIESRSHCLV